MKNSRINILFKLVMVMFVLFALQINKSNIALTENDMENVLAEEAEGNDDFDSFELEGCCQNNTIAHDDFTYKFNSNTIAHAFVFPQKRHFKADYIPPEI